MGFQRVADQSHEHPQIERGGRGADPSRVARAVFPLEGEGEVAAGEMARFEPRDCAVVAKTRSRGADPLSAS